MKRGNRFQRIAETRAKAYGIAALLVCAAVVMSRLLDPFIQPQISPPYFLAVMLAAIVGGQGPGLLATALSALAIGYFDLGSAGTLRLDLSDALRLFVFTLAALVIGSVSAARRKAEEELRVALDDLAEIDRAKDEFIATVSHELRTPLTSVLGWTSLLRDHDVDSETRQLAIESIHRSAETQAMLVDDLLEASRIVLGKLELDVGPLEVSQVIEEAIETVRPLAAEKTVTIASKLERQVLATGDRHRLKQVVWNLLTNAVKFGEPGGRIEVVLRGDGPEFVIEVADEGIGIDPMDLPHIFERFEQGRSGVDKGGIGLGLSIARHVVHLHGGRIWAESAGPGLGACFFVRMSRLGASAKPDLRLIAEQGRR
ncbi:MAG TPA: HAMP domain-containing sensor histidine kinase [Thermoanaerobaculia bacterium]|nr:HAMP domain-containing sensor histidine kinase [Thermoanaerobaculia bacterium]